MEYLKAEYRRLVRLFCEKYNRIIGQDILHKAKDRTSEKEKEDEERRKQKNKKF